MACTVFQSRLPADLRIYPCPSFWQHPKLRHVAVQWTLVTHEEQLLFTVFLSDLLQTHRISIFVNLVERSLQDDCADSRNDGYSELDRVIIVNILLCLLVTCM